MSQGFYDCDVKISVARNEFPESLSAVFHIVAFVWFFVRSITTAVDSDHLYPLSVSTEDPLGFSEIVPHFSELPTVSPVGTGFNRNQIQGAVFFELQVNSLRC